MTTTSSTDDYLQIYSYHCICTTLILTSNCKLEDLPRRSGAAQDHAIILSIRKPSELGSPATQTILSNTVLERKVFMISREDGFEKRRSLKCARCKLTLGYHILSEKSASSNAEVTYILPGSLLSTADMAAGKPPDIPVWAEETA